MLAEQLRRCASGCPGQTVFSDEPVKGRCAWCSKQLSPQVRTPCGWRERPRLLLEDIRAFAHRRALCHPFEHNDGTTHDLWVATGELSMLFGSETVITRERLRECGVEVRGGG